MHFPIKHSLETSPPGWTLLYTLASRNNKGTWIIRHGKIDVLVVKLRPNILELLTFLLAFEFLLVKDWNNSSSDVLQSLSIFHRYLSWCGPWFPVVAPTPILIWTIFTTKRPSAFVAWDYKRRGREYNWSGGWGCGTLVDISTRLSSMEYERWQPSKSKVVNNEATQYSYRLYILVTSVTKTTPYLGGGGSVRESCSRYCLICARIGSWSMRTSFMKPRN